MLPFSEFQTIILDLLEIEIQSCNSDDYMSRMPLVHGYAISLQQNNYCCSNAPTNALNEAISLGLYHLVEIYDAKDKTNDDWREVVYNHLKNNGELYVD